MQPEKAPQINSSTVLAQAFKNPYEHEVMGRAYEKALQIKRAEAINPDDFVDTYGQEFVDRCADYVDRRESEFAQLRSEDPQLVRAEIFGTTLEGLFHDLVKNGALGESVRSVTTSEYDDYRAGIDEILERRTADGTVQIGCAIDLTFGRPDKKIDAITEEIKEGKLRDLTFYNSPFGDPPEIHGQLNGIPRIVVGLDAEHIVKLSEQWLDDFESAANGQSLLLILQQIRKQADVFSEIARAQKQPEIQEKYDQIRQSIHKLYTELRLEREIDFLDEEMTNDKVYTGIKQNLDQLMQK